MLPTASQLTNGTASDVGVYVADQMKINQYFELLGAVRFDQYQFTQNAPLAVASVRHLSNTDDVVSWRAGAVGHPTPNTSVYIMSGTSFNPSYDNLTISVATPATALSQIALGPEKNETTEIGAKADVLNGTTLAGDGDVQDREDQPSRSRSWQLDGDDPERSRSRGRL